MLGDPGPPSVSSLFMFGSRSVSLTSMLEILDRSSRDARTSIARFRSTDAHAHNILEGVASDVAIAQMALWISHQDSLPREVLEKARKLYKYARDRSNRAFKLLDSQGYVKPLLGGSAASYKNAWHHAFSEGNSIQYTFMILHDVLGLKEKIDAGEKKETALLAWSHLPIPQVIPYKRIMTCSLLAKTRDWIVGIKVSARWHCVF